MKYIIVVTSKKSGEKLEYSCKSERECQILGEIFIKEGHKVEAFTI